MKIISLGGIGGCELATALRVLNQPAYPYDWMITTQSFIVNSFHNFDNFFHFDEKYIYDNEKLLVSDKKAIMLHDFKNFNLEKQQVIDKYIRRFERLNKTLSGKDEILFVRIYDNINEALIPMDYYNHILIREEEDVQKWDDFIDHLKNKYNKKIKLLIITSNQEICSKHSNSILHFTTEHKNSNKIIDIIKNTIKQF